MIVTEAEFKALIQEIYTDIPSDVEWVTGPGRSGAIAAVYVSYAFGLPFIPYCSLGPAHKRGLIIDMQPLSSLVRRKAEKRYYGAHIMSLYDTAADRVFWYERN